MNLDGKISLVNENYIMPTRINHFQNREFFEKVNNNINDNDNDNYYQFENLNNKFRTDNYFQNNNELNSPFQKSNNNNFNEEEKIIKSNNLSFKNFNENNEINSLNIEDLKKELEEKNNQINKISILFDQLSEEYSKLKAKYNSLKVYSSELEKQIDLFQIQNPNKSNSEINEITNKIIQEKNNMISILQNQVNYYKEAYNSSHKIIPLLNDNNNLNLSEKDYIEENKRLKAKLDLYSNIDFKVFESEINTEIDNFNEILRNYNNRLNEALIQIPDFFNKEKKEEAAKYLVKQVNYFMEENQKLFSENFKLKTEIKELKTKLNSKIKLDDYNNENDLNNKVQELENLIKTLNQNRNFIGQSKTGNSELQIRECLTRTMNELKEKDKIISDLKKQLVENINKNTLNFDERQIVNSMSKKLYEKDTLILSLKNQLDNGKNKVNEIRKNKEEFISKLNN